MQIILVVLALALAAEPFYPPEFVTKINQIQPHGIEILLFMVLLMTLSRSVIQMNVCKKLRSSVDELKSSRDLINEKLDAEKRRMTKELELQLSQLEEVKSAKKTCEADYEQRLSAAQDELAQLKKSAQSLEEEKNRFEEAFKSSQPQVDRLRHEIDELKKGQKGESSAATLMGLLQGKGRFLDFVMADTSGIPDEQLGAAARVVHQGCAEVISSHFDVCPVVEGEEGGAYDLSEDYDSQRFRLLGNVSDEGPYSGVLVHKGWLTKSIELPKSERAVNGLHIFAQAEIELS